MQYTDYWAIAVWGEMLGSYSYYVEAQQKKALEEGAPLDAIFKRHDGSGWARASELPEPRRSEVMRHSPG